jgi:hypothetical protein
VTYVNDTKDQAVLASDGQVATTSVSRDGSFQGSLGEELVHFVDTSNLVGGGVDGKHEHEDDSEEDGGVGAAESISIGKGSMVRDDTH